MQKKRVRRYKRKTKKTNKRIWVLLAVVAGIIVLILIVFPSVFSMGMVDRLAGLPYSKGDYNGIDVSKHQGEIDWDMVATDKHIQFVYIRATQGTSIIDKRYDDNIKGAKRAGLNVGSYHFLTSRTSIDEQFKNFMSVVDKSKQDLIPMIDIEEDNGDKWSREQLQDSVAKFSALIKKVYGRKPMIYSSQNFYNNMLAPRFNDHIIYLAAYGHLMPHMKGKHDHNLWQYSPHGHIHGIGEYVDLCRFTNGTTLKDIEL